MSVIAFISDVWRKRFGWDEPASSSAPGVTVTVSTPSASGFDKWLDEHMADPEFRREFRRAFDELRGRVR